MAEDITGYLVRKKKKKLAPDINAGRDGNELSVTEKVGRQGKYCVWALLYFADFFFKSKSPKPSFIYTLGAYEQDTNINTGDHFY